MTSDDWIPVKERIPDNDDMVLITYKQGIVSGNYSVASALSMVQGVVNLFLVMGTNYLSKRLTETSLW